jgi:hypothetical protein
MPLTDYAKDKFIAPYISAFTDAAIADLSEVGPARNGWVRSFILNSIFRGKFDGAVQAMLFNFLRRTQAAFEEHASARSATLAYLDNPETVSEYLTAISHWEILLSQTYQAYCLLDMGQRNLFKGQDGSTLARLNLLYGRTKHVEKAIISGQLSDSETFPVWLVNDGLRCPDGHLTFREIEEMLCDLADTAVAVQDPVTMNEKLAAIAASRAEDT